MLPMYTGRIKKPWKGRTAREGTLSIIQLLSSIYFPCCVRAPEVLCPAETAVCHAEQLVELRGLSGKRCNSTESRCPVVIFKEGHTDAAYGVINPKEGCPCDRF